MMNSKHHHVPIKHKDHHVPIKQSKLRGNTKPHISKTLRKKIMKRSRLKNKANKSGKEENKRL